MSKKHYDTFAAMLKTALAIATYDLDSAYGRWMDGNETEARVKYLKAEGALDMLHRIVKNICDILSADNEHFDRVRFIKAIYGEREVK